MRDQRAVIVDQTLMILVKRGVDQETIDEVKTRLEVELAKCEVYKRCTDLATVDRSPFEYLKEFLDVKRIEGKSEKTIERYKYEASRILFYCRKPLNEITTNDLRVYLDWRKRNGSKELSNRTIDNTRKAISPFFAWLTAERIIPYNPCLALHQIKYRKTVRTAYSQVEMQKLREACKSSRDTAMIDWLETTGCRVGEVETARLSDIDWNELSCIVAGKGDKERKVYFNTVTAMHLKKYLSERTDMVDALFVNRSGKPLTIGGIQQAIARIGKRAGVVKTHCHRFRHTLATNLSTKMPIIEVAEILGHEDISTTQIYCHADPTAVMADYKKAMA